jgi:formylmethanofuran dehydrogenase subunit E
MPTAQEILESEDFRRCEAFHGHVCPGLAIGFKAAQAAMARLNETRAADEEIVAVVETDACCVDAVQVLTGCTFGKGNFIHKDHGKMAFTFFSRTSGDGVRVSMSPRTSSPDPEHAELLKKVVADTADEAEQARFHELHFQRACRILETAADRLFVFEPVNMAMPPKAKMEPSQPCARCGEATMPSKMERVDGQTVCRGCRALDHHPQE